MRQSFSIFLHFLPFALCSQISLVQNASFEQNDPDAVVVACEFTQYSYDFPRKAAVWSSFRDGTPDLLRAAENCDWMKTVHSGEQCAGIILYLPAEDVGQRSDFHEFIQGQLSTPLKPGLKYRLECWVMIDSVIAKKHLAQVYGPKTPVVPVQSGNLGFCFSVAPFGLHEISTAAVAANKKKPQVNFSDIIRSNGQWIKLSTTFVPDQPFQHFTIGNFFADVATMNDLNMLEHRKIEQKNRTLSAPLDKVKRVNYLCIDDVLIFPENPPPPPVSLETALLKEKKYTFSAGVLFDSGKDELRPEAGRELDSLVLFLDKYPEIIIGISGHTDDVGSDEYNLDLSQRRAKSVQDYLEIKGIRADRLRSRGFGEARPVADNSTEAGRQANRRVECIVLKN
ncbi:MAG: OmpA family protein [Saprospiraceae bacterium]|nr:OmpA family protein [Saprospiraceae bacterium]